MRKQQCWMASGGAVLRVSGSEAAGAAKPETADTMDGSTCGAAAASSDWWPASQCAAHKLGCWASMPVHPGMSCMTLAWLTVDCCGHEYDATASWVNSKLNSVISAAMKRLVRVNFMVASIIAWLKRPQQPESMRALAVLRALWIQAAHFTRLQHAGAGQDEGGGAQRDFLLLRHGPHGVEGFLHDARQAGVDLVLAPEEAGKILHPFEVADGDAAGVGQYVRHDQHVLVGQDVVRFRRGRAVGAFEDDLGADARRVGGRDLLFQRGRDQDVGLDA